MTTKNRSIATQIGRSIAADNLDSTGSFLTTGSQGVIVYGADYTASSDLAAVDSSTLVDGSLHYLSKLNEMYIWDDSDGAFYSITLDSAWASAGGGYTFQGSVSGYASGGVVGSSFFNIIDKFPFAADANATDVGDLTVARYTLTSQSSSTNGYSSGGRAAGPSVNDVIDKFPFSTDGNATDVGDITVARDRLAGQSSADNGYTSGGYRADPFVRTNNIDKFPFSTDGNATDVGDLTFSRLGLVGNSSTTYGYNSGGIGPSSPPLSYTNTIDKFPFAVDANAADVGDLSIIGSYGAGQSSTENGYVSGGFSPAIPGAHPNIYKFPFASDANTTDIADITTQTFKGSGQSSTANGYVSGGSNSGTVIQKFPFSTDANASDVGDLTVERTGPTGQQV